MVVSNNQLWVAFVAANESRAILVCSSLDGRTWSPSSPVGGQRSKTAPALAVGRSLFIDDAVAEALASVAREE